MELLCIVYSAKKPSTPRPETIRNRGLDFVLDCNSLKFETLETGQRHVRLPLCRPHHQLDCAMNRVSYFQINMHIYVNRTCSSVSIICIDEEAALSTIEEFSSASSFNQIKSSRTYKERNKMQSQRPEQTRKRLKDSCNSCAISKVKCNKEKPSCTRCEERGMYCYYNPSQRSGRRSAPSSVGTVPVSTTVTPPAESLNFKSQNTNPNHTPTGQVSENSHLPEFQRNDFDGWDTGVIPASSLQGTPFDFTIASPLSYVNASNHVFGSVDRFSIGSGLSPSTGYDAGDSHMGNFGDPHPRILPTPLSLHDSNQHLCFDDKSTTERPHSCLDLALNIFPVLHIPPSTCKLLSVSPMEHDSSLFPTIDHVISTNKAIIDSVSTMLTCACSLDEHLASILTLITFKIMAWYAAAARDVDGNEPNYHSIADCERVVHSPITVGKYHLDGHDRRRMRAQLILSELHRVVRLVELLSKSFEKARSRTDVLVDGSRMEDMGTKNDWISASVFVQLEADLRKRLNAVTKETMTLLRCA